MADLGILGDIIGRELTSSNGREQVMKFLTSPEGVALLEEFFERPEARPIAGKLLMPNTRESRGSFYREAIVAAVHSGITLFSRFLSYCRIEVRENSP